MNNKMPSYNFSHCAGLAAVLFMSIFPMPVLRAQPAEQTAHGRFLFVFDTSSNMKRCEPAVENSLNTMLASSMNGHLHAGDTIGVWTFNQDLHPGDFSLQVWNPDDAVGIASNLTRFVRSRKYTNKPSFEVLQPLLNRVVRNSERLTVLVFSDGATKITGTTFDTGINQLFEQNAAVQKKARQPFVVALRSQQGKYIGCTVSYPPQLVSFPEFPPLPEPPPAPAPPAPAPVPAPVPAVVPPSLFITGTNIENRPAPPVATPAPTNPPPVIEPAPAAPANPPPVAVPVVPDGRLVPTNVPPVSPMNPLAPAIAPVVVPSANPIAPTNAPAVVSAASPVVPTNAHAIGLRNNPAPTTESPVAGVKPLVIGAICLVTAVVLTALLVFYFRRPDRRSLISRSMHDK
jgi:hypothetical protein